MGLFVPKSPSSGPIPITKRKALDPLNDPSLLAETRGRDQALTSLLGTSQTNTLASNTLLGV